MRHIDGQTKTISGRKILFALCGLANPHQNGDPRDKRICPQCARVEQRKR